MMHSVNVYDTYLPVLVLKARYLGGSAICTCIYIYVGVPDWALGWLSLGLGMVLASRIQSYSILQVTLVTTITN